MSLTVFEGPAGSGKTTRLFEKLTETLAGCPLGEDERVLALTKMHGSRRRMQGRLAAVPEISGRFDCTTIDSFAWRVVGRWRTLARTHGGEELGEDDYERVCECAGQLLSKRIVGRWATYRFPFVVIDEMQDSKDGQLKIIQALSQSATCLAAADDYQDLNPASSNEAVAWAEDHGEVELLTGNHRTAASGLLAAAGALRDGRTVPQNGQGFTVLAAMNKNMGASLVSKNLKWWRESNDIAIITPVRAQTSSFVRDLISRVEMKPIGDPPAGPFRVPWETSQEDQCDQFLASLNLPLDPSVEVSASEVSLPNNVGSSTALRAWFDQQGRLAGRTRFGASEIRQEVVRIHRRSRAHRRMREGGIRVMTVHQAKNREFESVIVLWPYEASGPADRQRRLLYNALTRAKRQALVVVQGPQRLTRPPFTGE